MNKHLQNYIKIIDLLETKGIEYTANLTQHNRGISYVIELEISKYYYNPMIQMDTEGNNVEYEINILEKGSIKILAKGFNGVIDWLNKQ